MSFPIASLEIAADSHSLLRGHGKKRQPWVHEQKGPGVIIEKGSLLLWVENNRDQCYFIAVVALACLYIHAVIHVMSSHQRASIQNYKIHSD